jgi:acetyl esterase/lipase
MLALNAPALIQTSARYAARVPRAKHVLDVYAPPGAHGRTVVVFVHGGGLIEGDRSWYRATGRSLANGGYVAVVPSYRYYPAVHPLDSARDIVAALEWVAEHIAALGGDPRKVVLAGHSAGGWHVDLVMMDRALWRGTAYARAPVAAAVYFSGDFADIIEPAPGESAADRAVDAMIEGPPGRGRRPLSPDSYPAARVPWFLVWRLMTTLGPVTTAMRSPAPCATRPFRSKRSRMVERTWVRSYTSTREDRPCGRRSTRGLKTSCTYDRSETAKYSERPR